MHKVLKPFPYAHDGIKTQLLEKGTVRAFDPAVVDGLVADGLIGPADPAESAPPKRGAKAAEG